MLRRSRSILFCLPVLVLIACTTKTKEADASDEKTEEVKTETSAETSELPGETIVLAELLANKDQYAGQTIRVAGNVLKVNTNIMDRNWVHIQDGSLAGRKEDMTIITADNVNVGDDVVFVGKVTLDKDFGAGYKYDIIIEDAVLVR